VTKQPYQPEIVKRGDYFRILSEFWADGPASETPPGHWNTVLNYVADYPGFVKAWGGDKTKILDPLEWDVKAYLALNGGLHDSAISAWSHKGYYDTSRPITVIRYMADKGQSSNSSLPNYSPRGFKLIPGLIEQITEQTARYPGIHSNIGVGNVGQIAIWAHKAPLNASQTGDVEWILAKDWWPYQRKTFVTPPFAGYISGHSTFSRCAAEVLTSITGSAFFPGGLGAFFFPKGQFLQFEYGPSANMSIQWATYRDAADESGLSRIFGGIHPYIDDFPGRVLGAQLGPQALQFAQKYYDGVARVKVVSSAGSIQSSVVGTQEQSSTLALLGVLGGAGICGTVLLVLYEIKRHANPEVI